MNYKNIMVDLETMSTKNHAAIISIGAVLMDFEKGVLGSTFYRTVDLESSVENGGHLCPKTVKWWLQQSDEAQHQLFNNTEPLTSVLIDFQRWLEDIGMRNMLKVWGNGATFDNVILRNAYDHQGWECPWPYWNDMCYRTEKTVNSHIDPPEMKGIFHHALDDAKFQALHLIEIMKEKNEQHKVF